VEGAERVRIHGEDIEVRAEVTRLEALSAHADHDELLRWIAYAVPERIALVHGEDEARQALAVALREEFEVEVLLPARGDTIDV
jgi:metallo-beta-lactamase family protein